MHSKWLDAHPCSRNLKSTSVLYMYMVCFDGNDVLCGCLLDLYKVYLLQSLAFYV